MKYYKLTILIFSFFIFTQCSNNDDNLVEDQGEDMMATSIIFSAPPIDLQGIEALFAENISYDEFEQTQFDIFLPNSSNPTGLLIYIHGGGFTGGDKDVLYDRADLQETTRTLLSNNMAVATINYRLLTENDNEGVLKSLNDSRRALQYIRSRNQDLNIDKENIVLAGGSAGAGTSLWIAVNDDMSDHSNTDSVLHESTRVKGIAITQTQSSYDIEDRWINDVFIDFNTTFDDIFSVQSEARLLQFYGVSSLEEYHTLEIDAYRDQVDMLDFLSSDDPEIWAESVSTPVVAPTTSGIANHHAFHVREIKERADALGIPNVVYYGRDPIIFSDPSNETFTDFILRKLTE